MLAKFADDEKLEQLTAEKKRLKMMEHRREIQEILKEKQRQCQEEWEKLRAQEEFRQKEDKRR